MRRGLLIVAVTLALAGGARADGPPYSGWTTYGNDVSRIGYTPVPAIADPAALNLLWTVQLDGDITSQPLVLRDFPTPGETRTFVGTSSGKLYLINQNGYVVGLKQLATTSFAPTCYYLPGNRFGVTGTPAIDTATGTIYVSDGAGYVHALDVVTLAERPGWPVRLFTNPHQQMLWGALTLAKGRVFAASGILCQAASTHAYAINIATRAVKSWETIPLSLGGGGGIWGWGGMMYDAPSNSIFTATGDALPGGRNRGANFDESSGFAERVVQLDLDMKLKASHSPLHYKVVRDSDFTGTPIPVRVPGCPALVVAENKNGTLYVYRLNNLGAGVYQRVVISSNLNGQPAWSPASRSLYVTGHVRFFRVAMNSACKFKISWSIPLGTRSVNGPPLVAATSSGRPSRRIRRSGRSTRSPASC